MQMSEESLVKAKDQKGCFLTPCKGFVVFLVAAAACAIVGVVVYYGHPDYNSGGATTVKQSPTTSPTTSPTDAPASDSILLPGTMVPDHYDLRLRPDIYRDDPDNFIFSGDVAIHINVTSATNEVTLHQRNLNIFERTLSVKRGDESLQVSYVKKELEKEFYTIVLAEDLKSGDRITVSMEFEGPLRRDLRGIYWSSYVDGGTTKYLVTSQLQSTDARKTFPCFDEPQYKATFTVRLEYRAPLATQSNMLIESTTQIGDGWWADQYGPTPIMSSYLLAFLVSDFECKNTTARDAIVYVCARPNAIDQVDYALSIAGKMQEFFEDYHEIAYPLPKTVHVAVPDFAAGAMENWGLMVYRKIALLYKPGVSSTVFRQFIARIISHELAHMWFGNLVTCEWWDDIWLNEGFASYMENLGVDSQHTDANGNKLWEMEAQFVVDGLQYVFIDDGLLSSHPVYQPVNHPDEISQVFDGITYDKGSSVIRMMNYFLGEEIFKQGLTKYLNENVYGVTNHRELFNFLTQEAKDSGLDIDVSEVMNTWILQMGYPTITITKNGTTITMRQDRFLFDDNGEVQPSPYDYKWIVPVTYVTTDTADTDPDDLTIHWLRDESDSVTDAAATGAWILGNVGQRFYYRVNYEESNWRAIYQQLVDNHQVFSIINRAQIISDSFNLGRSGTIDQTMALDAIEYMESEEHYIPWRALSKNIGYFRVMMQYTPTSIGPLNTFMQGILESTASDVGWEETGDVDKDHLENRLRPLIHSFSCAYGASACLSNTSAKYADWKNNNMKPSVNFIELVSCYGIRSGSQAEWDFALDQYENSNVASEKTLLLYSLGCASERTILENYLNMLLTREQDGGKIKDQDASTVMAAVAYNPIYGKDVAWTFFKDNYDNYIFPTYGSSTFRFASLIRTLTTRFSTQEELDDLKEFIAANPVQGTGDVAYQQAIESISANIAWREMHEENIVKWLNEKNNS